MTQKDELEKANAKIKELQPKADAHDALQSRAETAEASLKAAETTRDTETARANKAETDLKAATERAEKAEKDASDLKAKADGLEQTSKNTEEKAREQNARMGLNSAGPKADDVVTGASEDIAAVAETFTNPKTSMTEKAALLKKHGSKLVSYAGSLPTR